jgi:hypothetical protein
MMPPECEICQANLRDDPELRFDTVAFADLVPLPDGMTGHPDGLLWFCAEHFKDAEPLAHLPWRRALRQLRGA